MSLDNRDLEKRFDDRRDKKKKAKSGLPGPDEEPLPPPVDPIQAQKTVGRNDPCPCGSGKKYKKCCGK